MASLKTITTNDIFKLLSHRVLFSFDDFPTNDLQKVSFFKESLDLLEYLENFVSGIKEGTAPTKEEYVKAVESNNQKDIQRICAYFSKLRHLEKFEPFYLLEFSENYRVLHLSYIDAGSRENTPACVNANAVDVKAIKRRGGISYEKCDWTTDSFPHEKCFEVIANVRRNLESRFAFHQIFNEQYLQQMKAGYQIIDRLLEQYSLVRSLSLDVRLIHDFHQRNINNHENYDKFFQYSLPDIRTVKEVIQTMPFLLCVFFKVEHDYQLGLNVHAIVIFQNQPKVYEDQILQELRDKLISSLNGRQTIEVKNWNKVIRVHFSKSAVGVIRKDNTRQVEEFKYWILSYFFRVDQYLKLKGYDENDRVNSFFDGQPLARTVLAPPVKKVEAAITFSALLSEKDEKQIWQTTHLSKDVKHRLSIAKLYYGEIVAQEWGLTKSMRCLLNIEIFIETLLHSPILAFNFPSERLFVNFTEKDLANSTTRIGKQFLSLCKQRDDLVLLTRSAKRFNCVNVYTQYFLYSYLCWISSYSSLTLNAPITKPQMDSYNDLISDLRATYHKKINEIPTKPFALNFIENEKTTVTPLEYKYSVCKTRQSTATSYVKQLLKRDCILYRVQLKCIRHGGRLTQNDFSKLFTMFIRFGKRAKPLSWMHGYIGIWQEDATFNPFADVVLFLDHQAYDQRDNIIQQINDYWTKFIGSKIESIMGISKVDVSGLALSVNLLFSIAEMNQPYLLIESTDITKQKLIIDKLIPYFSYRDLYQCESTDIIPKAFIKGSPQKSTQSHKSQKPKLTSTSNKV